MAPAPLKLTADARLAEIYEELVQYPGPAAPEPPDAGAITVPLRLAPAPGSDGPELTFFSTITTFGTATEVTVAELSVEAFFPADAVTAEALRAAAAA